MAARRRSRSLAFATAVAAVALAFPLAGCSSSVAEDAVAESGSDLTISNGFSIKNGAYLANGARMLNGVRVLNGFSIKNGAQVVGGLQVAKTAIARGGVAVPNGVKLTMTTGGALAAWLDEDVANNTLVLQYVAQCALQPDQGLQFDFEGKQYQVAGILGLGAGWITGTMTTTEQEQVSSCLLARVNSAGVHIEIELTSNFSMNPKLSSPLKASLAPFDAAYPVSEIVTYGNLFADTPMLAGCLPSGSSDMAQSETVVPAKQNYIRDTRMCATMPFTWVGDDMFCGPFLMNHCSHVCKFAWIGGRYIPTSCGTSPDNEALYSSPITVRYAPAPSGSACNYDWQCGPSASKPTWDPYCDSTSHCALEPPT